MVRISSESLPPQLRIEVEKQIITDVAHCMELVRKIENANISIYDKSLYTGKSVQNQFTTYNANNGINNTIIIIITIDINLKII